jgi:biotin carboxyl carrier protein
VKYFAAVNGHEYEIEIENDQVLVNGEAIDVNVSQIGVPELYSILLDGASYEVLVEEQRQEYAVTLAGQQFHVQVEDERTRRLNAGRKGPLIPSGELVVKAPIPGLVVKVLVQEGDDIPEDHPLIILEAMKMENEIRSLRAGVVRSVDVAAGQRVEQGAALLVLA